MMLEKSSTSPSSRMLNLFDILNDWLQAPLIKEQLHSLTINKQAPAILHDYLTLQATLAKAALPEILAHQIYFMLTSAIKEAISAGEFKGFLHAKLAANALITAQTDTSEESDFHKQSDSAQSGQTKARKTTSTRKAAYGLALSLVLCLLGLYIGLHQQWISPPTLSAIKYLEKKSPSKNPLATASYASQTEGLNTSQLSPLQVSTLLAKVEQMRKGNCQLLEAIQIPDQHKNTYFKVVVEGEAPKDLGELEIANFYLQKVRCNYTPMLMSNSTN